MTKEEKQAVIVANQFVKAVNSLQSFYDDPEVVYTEIESMMRSELVSKGTRETLKDILKILRCEQDVGGWR